jgi:glycosyltransferase involved in cell wall biosynthesis
MTGLRGARPIIASGIGGFAELLEDGRHGFLVPPGDPDALSAAMSRLIREPAARQHFSREIGALVSTIPSWREIALRTSAVYTAARGNSPDARHETRNIAPSP